jgi:trimethylamine:corrinoid methyltransferase-like protein
MSLEKLVLDNEICGMVGRLARTSHRFSSRGHRGAVPSGVFDPRGAESDSTVRRAHRGEKTLLGGVHRRPQQEAGEKCGLVEGIEPREDFPSTPIFEELIRDRHLLIADHTRRHLKDEITFPGPVVDRANSSRWLEEGGVSLYDRAAKEVERLVTSHTPSRLPAEIAAELDRLMTSEARRFGMDRLPDRD